MTPVRYECDPKNLTSSFARSKILFTEKLTNGALVPPTPDLQQSPPVGAIFAVGCAVSYRDCAIMPHGCDRENLCAWKASTLRMMTSSNGSIFRVTGHLCGEFTGHRWIPAQRPVTRSFDVFFDLRLNKRLSKQSWRCWFETLSRPLWRHCNGSAQMPSVCGMIIFAVHPKRYEHGSPLLCYIVVSYMSPGSIDVLQEYLTDTARWLPHC